MKITSVEKNRKNKDKLSVYIDNQYCFTIPEEDFLRLNLYEKSEISQDEVAYIRSEVLFREAKSVAVKFLSMRLRSEGEVRKKLEDEGFDNTVIDQAIEELQSVGYINDKIYVQKYLYDRSKLKPKSKKLLKLELQSRGIREEIIDSILDEWDLDEELVAEGLVRKKFGKYDLQHEKIMRRVYMFLKHRGFSYELANRIIQKMINGTDD